MEGRLLGGRGHTGLRSTLFVVFLSFLTILLFSLQLRLDVNVLLVVTLLLRCTGIYLNGVLDTADELFTDAGLSAVGATLLFLVYLFLAGRKTSNKPLPASAALGSNTNEERVALFKELFSHMQVSTSNATGRPQSRCFNLATHRLGQHLRWRICASVVIHPLTQDSFQHSLTHSLAHCR